MLDWQIHKKINLLVKTVCIVLIVTFLASDLSWAGATKVLSVKTRPASLSEQYPPLIETPKERGVINVSSTSDHNSHKPVIYIQNARILINTQPLIRNVLTRRKNEKTNF